MNDDMTYSQAGSAIHSNGSGMNDVSNTSTGDLFNEPGDLIEDTILFIQNSRSPTYPTLPLPKCFPERMNPSLDHQPHAYPPIPGPGAPKKKDRKHTTRKVATYLDGLDSTTGCSVCLFGFFMFREYQGNVLPALAAAGLLLDNKDVEEHFAKTCPYDVDYTNYFEQVKFYVGKYKHLPQIYEIFHRKIADARSGLKQAKFTPTWFIKLAEECADEAFTAYKKGLVSTNVSNFFKSPDVQTLVEEQQLSPSLSPSLSPPIFMAVPEVVFNMRIDANFGDDCGDFFNQIHNKSDYE